MRAQSAIAAKKPSSIPRASPGARYLNACMTAQVEVKLKGVGDVGIHCCSCWDVPTLSNLQGIERDKHCRVRLFPIAKSTVLNTAALPQDHGRGSPPLFEV